MAMHAAHPPVPPVAPEWRINVGRSERWASTLGGALLVALGLSSRSLRGLGAAAAGGALVYRGVTGHCPVFATLGMDTSEEAAPPAPVSVRTTLTIARPHGELYAYWRDVERLPSFMHHLASVHHRDERVSEWTARIPGDHGTISWMAEVVDDEPGRRIAWRSLPGADVHNAGEVRFEDAPGDRGTEVHVAIDYRPPGADAGRRIGALFTPAFEGMIREDLRRFKHLMETGEIPVSDASPKPPSETFPEASSEASSIA